MLALTVVAEEPPSPPHASPLTPWCRAILQPGAVNDPLIHMGRDHAPADFVNVYVHMLSMMNYLGFHNVSERVQLILKVLARCLRPESGLPKSTFQGRQTATTRKMIGRMDVPEPGPQPPRPRKPFVVRAWDPKGSDLRTLVAISITTH